MITKMRVFKMLKDTPEAKAGCLIYEDDNGDYSDKDRNGIVFYLGKIVENSPEWFEEIFEGNLPKDWLEAVNRYKQKNKLFYITGSCEIKEISALNTRIDANYNGDFIATKLQAKSVLAFCQLSIIHAQMVGDWRADWGDFAQNKYAITRYINSLVETTLTTTYFPLVFPTKEMKDFSLKYHKELWEQYYQL
jgi:hypothetical protein